MPSWSVVISYRLKRYGDFEPGAWAKTVSIPWVANSKQIKISLFIDNHKVEKWLADANIKKTGGGGKRGICGQWAGGSGQDMVKEV